MIRPTLEVADIIRAQGEHFIERSRSWLTWAQRKVLYAIARCRTAALAVTGTDARVAAIAPSPTTHVAIATVPSVRRAHATVGWRNGARNYSPFATCM